MGSDRPSQGRTDRWAAIGIWIVIGYTFFKNVLAASARPFWFDELCTVAVARQPNLPAMWKAFGQAEDSGTQAFSLAEHFCSRLIANQEVAYRLPSILAFGCILWCLFVFLRPSSGAAVALLCALVPMLTPLYRPYAVEARGYALVVACIAIALVCYQRASRWPWLFFMGLSLMAAEALHYYGFFMFFPFGLAELTWAAKKKRVRSGVWLALFAGFLPLAIGWRHLMQIKQAYGPHFWGQASLMNAASAFGLLLKTFPPIALGIVTMLSAVALWATFASGFPAVDEEREINGSHDGWHEPMLAVGFLSLLLVELVVTKIAHGSLAERYALAIAFGLALATSYLVRMLGRRTIPLVAIFLLVACSLQEAFFWVSGRGHLGKLESPAPPIEALVSAAGYGDLPVVVSDGQAYVQIAYYAPPDWSRRFVGIVDPPNAAVYAGSDTLDRQMFVLPCCLPLQVYEFHAFALNHPRFLLYSNGAEFDWWPQRLLRDGYTLRLVESAGGSKVYLADRNGAN